MNIVAVGAGMWTVVVLSAVPVAQSVGIGDEIPFIGTLAHLGSTGVLLWVVWLQIGEIRDARQTRQADRTLFAATLEKTFDNHNRALDVICDREAKRDAENRKALSALNATLRLLSNTCAEVKARRSAEGP